MPPSTLSFPYPVRALRVRLLVASNGPGMAHEFLPLLKKEGASRIAPRSTRENLALLIRSREKTEKIAT